MLNVRRMLVSDGDVIAHLEEQTFSDAWSKNSILETLGNAQAFILVAEREDKIVGYCIVYYVLDEAEIARIAVDSSLRRQGVGREILLETCRVCKELGMERLLLDVRESNETARGFYENFGFAVDGIRKNFYENPKEHAVLMSMMLE